MYVWAAGLAFAVALMLTRSFLRPESRLHILDYPNERSLHSQPTPRTGGVAIVAGIVAGGLLLALTSASAIPRELGWLAGAAGLVAGVSFLDDRSHLPAGYRLAVHFTAALLLFGMARLALDAVSLPGLSLELPAWLAGGLTVLYIVWMINLYNFMDGMDGFAAGMALCGFGTFAVMAWLAGHQLFFAASLIAAAASTGFLVFNFPPARIFMGDMGSSTLGFLAAGLSLWGAGSGVFPSWAALLVFSPFIVDATVTVLRRLVRGQRIWQAHKSHYYQKLVQAGWSHRKTLLAQYFVMLGCSITAVFCLYATVAVQLLLLAGWAVFYAVFFSWISGHASARA